jgi:YrbI family 3-deoxy-D-manno-octulosonate 8-phosphate phosphatase
VKRKPAKARSLRARVRAVRLLALDFDGVFTDNMVYVSQDGTETVRCFRGDGLGLARLPRLGVQAAVVSTEVNPVVSARCRKLNLRCVQGRADKRRALEDLMRELGVSAAQVAFVGNDTNDRQCLEMVGLPIVVHDAHEDVAPLGAYRTKARGGHGAVREVCDLIERLRNR